MDHQRIIFSTYLSLLYGTSLSLLTEILIHRDIYSTYSIQIVDPRIHWSTIVASCVYYSCSPHIQWWVGQDEYRNTLVQWKMRGIVWFAMSIWYPLVTVCLTDGILLMLGEKIECMTDRYLYGPSIAMILTAVCELCGVNQSIRRAYLTHED